MVSLANIVMVKHASSIVRAVEPLQVKCISKVHKNSQRMNQWEEEEHINGL